MLTLVHSVRFRFPHTARKGQVWSVFPDHPSEDGAMAYLITHFYEGGTLDQYNAALDAAHPGGNLPPGQTFHAGGPTEGGFLVVALWDSQEACDTFIQNTLMPSLQEVEGTFSGPPQQRASEVINVVTG
jgi:hypothetical protein